MKSRMWLGITALLVILMATAGFVVWKKSPEKTVSPIGIFQKEKPLEKYSIENLGKQIFLPSQIVFETPTATTSSYTVVPFYFSVDGKKVSGIAHLPMTPSSKKMPVIVQCRGYADKEKYIPGLGTNRSAEVYAANGFLTLAPDFLGYGSSDTAYDNAFEDRFSTYTAILTLLSSIGTIPFADTGHVFLWGHSNGGQIALTVVTILGENGKKYPTTLWAPVTAMFPYSILYYMDEFDDYGKALRKALSEFEKDYDTDAYAFGRYLSRITAPLQLHQGGSDPEVPQVWSDTFVKQMKTLGKSVKYFTYPTADHNMMPSWNTVVERDIQFFRSFL